MQTIIIDNESINITNKVFKFLFRELKNFKYLNFKIVKELVLNNHDLIVISSYIRKRGNESFAMVHIGANEPILEADSNTISDCEKYIVITRIAINEI